MRNFNAILFAFILSVTFAVAQPKMEFPVLEHNFGSVNEGDIATHEFKVINTGTEPLVITNVRASCGCTTPFWTREPIAPGKSGSIKASYNSNGRPGPFHKSVNVTSNATDQNSVNLFIKGNVISKSERKYTPEELANSPKIMMPITVKTLGRVEVGQRTTVRFEVKNVGASPLEVTGVSSSCRCVNYALTQPNVKPNSTAILELFYTPNSAGKARESVYINLNDLNTPMITLTLNADVVDASASQSVIKENRSNVPFK